MMTAVQFLNALNRYGADVLLIAAAVTLLTAVLKKTVLANCPKKVFVFLPFLIGLVIYAVYRTVATWSIAPLSTDIASTIEGGLSCGSVATVYYIIYEQFFRKGKMTFSLSPALAGIVPDETREEAANALIEGGKTCAAEELYAFVSETLGRYADETLTEAELEAAVRAIAALLKALQG